jgi:hypothetical protein
VEEEGFKDNQYQFEAERMMNGDLSQSNLPRIWEEECSVNVNNDNQI